MPRSRQACRHVDRVFEKDHRIVVGERDGAAAARAPPLRRSPAGEACRCSAVELAGLGDVPVLAELAGEVAAGGAEGQHRRAGQEVVERLLLDRIDAEAGRAAVGREHDLGRPAAPRTKHRPRWPSCSLQSRGQRSHWMRPSASGMPIAAGHALDDRLIHFDGVDVRMRYYIEPQARGGQWRIRLRSAQKSARRRWRARSTPADAAAAAARPSRHLLAAAPALLELSPRRLIAPHAGYVYSGGVAGAAFATLSRRAGLNRIVLIGPAHYVRCAASLCRRPMPSRRRSAACRSIATRWRRSASCRLSGRG